MKFSSSGKPNHRNENDLNLIYNELKTKRKLYP